jgi:hypothetical protein
VEITMTYPASAARPRTLSRPQTADWYAPTQAPTMRDGSVLVTGSNDNSINLPTAGVVGFGAAKQAAPPRGVPR